LIVKKRTKPSTATANPNRPPNFQTFAKIVSSGSKEAMQFIDEKQLKKMHGITLDLLRELSGTEDVANQSKLADVRKGEKILTRVERTLQGLMSSLQNSRQDRGYWTREYSRMLLDPVAKCMEAIGSIIDDEKRMIRGRKLLYSTPQLKTARHVFANHMGSHLSRILPNQKRSQRINSILAAIMFSTGALEQLEDESAKIARIRRLRSAAKGFPPSQWDEENESLLPEAVKKRQENAQSILYPSYEPVVAAPEPTSPALKQRSKKKQPAAGKRQNSSKIKRKT
jgi:hypothetical protein